ncbi:hypothetical protein ABIA16_000130 [Sinorhizobium fredii]
MSARASRRRDAHLACEQTNAPDPFRGISFWGNAMAAEGACASRPREVNRRSCLGFSGRPPSFPGKCLPALPWHARGALFEARFHKLASARSSIATARLGSSASEPRLIHLPPVPIIPPAPHGQPVLASRPLSRRSSAPHTPAARFGNVGNCHRRKIEPHRHQDARTRRISPVIATRCTPRSRTITIDLERDRLQS